MRCGTHVILADLHFRERNVLREEVVCYILKIRQRESLFSAKGNCTLMQGLCPLGYCYVLCQANFKTRTFLTKLWGGSKRLQLIRLTVLAGTKHLSPHMQTGHMRIAKRPTGCYNFKPTEQMI